MGRFKRVFVDFSNLIPWLKPLKNCVINPPSFEDAKIRLIWIFVGENKQICVNTLAIFIPIFYEFLELKISVVLTWKFRQVGLKNRSFGI